MSRGNLIERTLAVLQTLSLRETPVKLSDVADSLDMPKSAVHRILSSLTETGWAEQSPDTECYQLTLHMALLGQQQLKRLAVTSLRQPILDDVARQTRELVRLTAVQNDRLVWIGSSRGRTTGLVYEPDMSERIVPFATANGKVWLSSMPLDAAVRIAIEAGLGSQPGPGPKAISTIPQLMDELDRTRSRGWGYAGEEAEVGVSAVAVPIGDRERFLGTMSVAAPVTRLGMDRAERLLPLLWRAAERMSFAWHDTPTPAQ